jgi:hypothetical protein
MAFLTAEREKLNRRSKSRWAQWRREAGIPARSARDRYACLGAIARAVLLCLMSVCADSAQTNPSSEYEVKAAFLFHFAQFVEWPEETFKDASSPLTYCTIGADPFHGSLDAALSGKTVGARSLRVMHYRQLQDMRGCQVLFIGEGEHKLVPPLLTSLKGIPALTVGESQDFVQDGGMIGFLLEEDKIRFEINLDAAEHARLKVSSRLLALAKRVIGGQRGI